MESKLKQRRIAELIEKPTAPYYVLEEPNFRNEKESTLSNTKEESRTPILDREPYQTHAEERNEPPKSELVTPKWGTLDTPKKGTNFKIRIGHTKVGNEPPKSELVTPKDGNKPQNSNWSHRRREQTSKFELVTPKWGTNLPNPN
ncbi:hypothetical protein CHS0354_016229 [Potamilus streckersoni]|uniref:Uncharacterized protein n=1 Tax=Potamilus streckersoni TaxID=2493646 RepID=A0AAE0RXF4_9BIVA|nr:hypothetical protein CHS0354_016229 [Potamilus streckersoni]